MRTLTTLALALMLSIQPAFADDVEESINAALEAYRAGDIKAAKEEIDFASQLLGQLQAEGLSGYLPQAFDEGWNGEAPGPEFALRAARRYFNNRKTSIYGGSNEIQRNIVTKAILGL